MIVLSFFLLFGQALLAGFWITGVATVIDGDTIEIQGQRIRLYGIDAPESNQWCTDEEGSTVRCGQQAALVLDSLLQGQICKCEVVDTDRYGRQVAICYVDELDINRWMVERGWALAYRKYSEDYVAAEHRAQAEGQGIRRYRFEEPWKYRAFRHPARAAVRPSSRLSTATGVASRTIPVVEDSTKEAVYSQPSDACTIKGNISSNGERMFRTQSSPWYTRTQINEAKGERWFCNEQEARQAGWRKAEQ